MKLRARISLEIDVDDFAAAAHHEQALKAFFRALQRDYQTASLDFREAPDKSLGQKRAARRHAGHVPMRRATGNLNQYLD